jgi:hypothetical protein
MELGEAAMADKGLDRRAKVVTANWPLFYENAK